MESKGFSEAEREIVTALLETKAVNFEALGAIVARHGDRITLHLDGEDAFCGTMRRFARVLRLRDELAGLEHLAELKELNTKMRG